MAYIYDITRTVSPEMAVWPGDSPFSFEQVMSVAEGAAANVTTITLSPHTGTHIDAPWHFTLDGPHPADLPLDAYTGPAHVVTVERQHGGITPADLAGAELDGVERLLIHTWASDLAADDWPRDFPYPTVELADWLAAQGGVLLGVDVPSVDAFESEDLAVHHRLYEHGIMNIERLALHGVPDGVYELTALPLKIAGICGSPVRAILREIE